MTDADAIKLELSQRSRGIRRLIKNLEKEINDLDWFYYHARRANKSLDPWPPEISTIHEEIEELLVRKEQHEGWG
jgi:hypothetical protein